MCYVADRFASKCECQNCWRNVRIIRPWPISLMTIINSHWYMCLCALIRREAIWNNLRKYPVKKRTDWKKIVSRDKNLVQKSCFLTLLTLNCKPRFKLNLEIFLFNKQVYMCHTYVYLYTQIEVNLI